MRAPMIPAPLDADFVPMSLVLENFSKRAAKMGGPMLHIALERNNGLVARYSMQVLPRDVDEVTNLFVAERIFKTMLWLYGGYKAYIAGDKLIYEGLKKLYCPGGRQEFDAKSMADVYDHPFEILFCGSAAELPKENEMAQTVGGHLKGCRIGFDAGGSDRKVSAVVDGETVYSEEVIWFPKNHSEPEYHYDGILTAFQTAASKMPRVDAIGVSSAGIYVNNETRLASLFMKVSPEDFEKSIRNIYIRAAAEIGKDIPLVVCNDGDVTALAGAMSLKENGILGIAMGTSEAGGYVDPEGKIKGWLNELAFIPCDGAENAAKDEWSGDIGCGAKYFSQDAVIRLAPAAGIKLNEDASPAEKLRAVQAELDAGNPGAAQIFETMGVYLGYTVPYYAKFFDIHQLLLMGRVTSGKGGDIMVQKAREVLEKEFPSLNIRITLPDEKSRRVGQSVAAASLPEA